MQVTGAAKEGNIIKLTVEPAKGGEPETLEADVVLVSAGITVVSRTWGLPASALPPWTNEKP